MDLPFTRVEDGIIVEVKVEPRSSKKEISGVMGRAIRVRLTAPPVDGEANEQLIEVLSKRFGIKKSSIIILKGKSSRHKMVKIKGVSL